MCKNSERWVFTLAQDFTWHSGIPVSEDLAFKDRAGVVRLILRQPDVVTVTQGYSWDGCTPKVCFLDVNFGTPDGVIDSRTKQPKTYYASLVHDALYQFLLDGLPLSLAQADACFRRLMAETGFALRTVYWLAVRLVGWLVILMHRKKRRNKGTRVALGSAAMV